MLKYTNVSKEEVLRELNTKDCGLPKREAEARLQKLGPNKLKEQKRRSAVALFFAQFCDVMTIMLIAAACISGVIAITSHEAADLADTAIIAAIVLLNAAVGTVQQYRADKAVEKLKKLTCVTAKVKRDGYVTKIDAEQLVVGDVVMLEEGDVVPADLRIISSFGLTCAEASLTGESAGVSKTDGVVTAKNINYHTAKNLAFSSTFVVGGSGEGVVIATADDTEIGSIAGMLGSVKKAESPLERSLNKLGKVISAFVILVAAAVFAVGLFAQNVPVIKNFMTAVAVAVAAIPEGLPAVVSVIMAMGVQRMSGERVIIRKLKCVETLGCCTCICTDKTGTLTCNEMKVVETFTFPKSNSSGDSAGVIEKIYACMTVCNGAKEGESGFVGDPTEVALKVYAAKQGFKKDYIKTGEVPFSSESKYMAVSALYSGRGMVFVKGAAEEVLKRCSFEVTSNGVQPLKENTKRDFLNVCADMSGRALRVLAFAYREDAAPCSGEQRGLTLLGCCGLLDDLREGVKEAVEMCNRAGITTVMLTGDSAPTALAIARRAGICRDESLVYTGDELDAMTKPQLKAAVKRGRVFARVTPKHKNIIVKLKQASGEVVAMTGDGVNDAPGLKSADIGVVMGQTGTEVAKSVADMVITDDNFATIVSGVREGRRISSNIKKTIQFFLSTNLAEVFAILIVTFAFFGQGFLSSTQLLWLNLITDSFPVLALGVESGTPYDMLCPPQRVEKAIFSPSSVGFILFSSLYITGVTVGIYSFSLNFYGTDVAVTMAFITLTFLELFHVFNVRSGKRSAVEGMFSNRVLLFTVALGIVVNVALCISPLASAFGVAELNVNLWLIAFAAALSVIPVCEAYKFAFFKLTLGKVGKRRGVGARV